MGSSLLKTTTTVRSATDDWVAFLNEHNIIEGIGGAPDPFRVIRLNEELWGRNRSATQQTLPGMAGGVPAGEPIATPASFLRDLRARFAATHRVRVHAGDITLPAILRHLASVITASRALLDLEDDWDGEGSVGYSYETWFRAIRFLASSAERLWEELGIVTPAPDIGAGPDGSIDLHWPLPHRELLINFPRDTTQDAGFYGDDGNRGEPIEGKLSTDRSRMWVLMWLANQ